MRGLRESPIKLAAATWAATLALAGAEDPARLREHALKAPGDPGRGRRLFDEAGPITCRACHKTAGQGGDAGPDLTNIGGKFERLHLIESVLAPSRQVVEGYRVSTLALRDGRVLTGLVRGESAGALTLIGPDARTTTVSTAEIEERRDDGGSLMPEGLAAAWSADQFADLIAYLESLRPARKLTPGERRSGALAVPAGFRVREVARGLTGTTALEVAPDGRVFICEQTGTLRVVHDDTLLPTPFLRLDVDATWERGLIGVTVDPDFPAHPFVYVCYVSPRPYPHHVVSRFTARGDRAEPDSERVLLEGDDQTRLGGSVPAGHQGGALHFGRDGKLYIALGEQTAKAPAQDLRSLLGKVLRLHPDGGIPEDNPFVIETEGKYRAIWARGLRNRFTFAVQPETGRIFLNDVGQDAWEEINEGVPGGNYGWPVHEGPTNDPRHLGPIHSYKAASIAGGAFCPSDGPWPAPYRGRYFFMDFVRGWVHVLDPDRPTDVTEFATGLPRPVDLRFAPDGALYVLVRDAWVIDDAFQPGTGALLKIEPSP